MTGPQGRRMKRTGETPRRVQRRRYVPFPTPDMSEPDRWHLVKRKAGSYVIVDADGQPVLEHWDPVVRRYNLHLAKAAPAQVFALSWAYRWISNSAVERAHKGWILTLISNAAHEGIPKVDPSLARVVVSKAEHTRGQEVTELDREEAA